MMTLFILVFFCIICILSASEPQPQGNAGHSNSIELANGERRNDTSTSVTFLEHLMDHGWNVGNALTQSGPIKYYGKIEPPGKYLAVFWEANSFEGKWWNHCQPDKGRELDYFFLSDFQLTQKTLKYMMKREEDIGKYLSLCFKQLEWLWIEAKDGNFEFCVKNSEKTNCLENRQMGKTSIQVHFCSFFENNPNVHLNIVPENYREFDGVPEQRAFWFQSEECKKREKIKFGPESIPAEGGSNESGETFDFGESSKAGAKFSQIGKLKHKEKKGKEAILPSISLNYREKKPVSKQSPKRSLLRTMPKSSSDSDIKPDKKSAKKVAPIIVECKCGHRRMEQTKNEIWDTQLNL